MRILESKELRSCILESRGVFEELRGFRILGSSNLRILVVAICELKGFRARSTGPNRVDYHRMGVHPSCLGASGGSSWRSWFLHCAPSCSQHLPRQPNLQPRSPKTTQLGLNMAILARFSSIWLEFQTPNHKKKKKHDRVF